MQMPTQMKTSNQDAIVLDPDESDGSCSFSDEEQERELSDVETDDKISEFNYTLKLVNPKCKADFQTIKLGAAKKFKSLSSLQEFIYKTISANPKFQAPDLMNVEMGYMESGHGLKGRKIWLYSDGDVKIMYDYYEKSTSILLWCYTEAGTQTAKKKKGSVSTSKSSKSGTKYGQHLEDRTAVDDIYKELQEKHTSYSPRRLRAWANMVNMKSWASLDEPPNKPFFTRGRKRSSEDNASTETPATKKPSSIASPGRKVRVRTELIDQLDKFHKLKESGALSLTEYDELRSSILSDIKNL